MAVRKRKRTKYSNWGIALKVLVKYACIYLNSLKKGQSLCILIKLEVFIL